MAAPVLLKGSGCRVWDVDGNEYIEFGMGLRAVTLGHAFGPVVDAAHDQMRLGSNFTRPTLIELECADELHSMVGGEMVKFAKNGSDVVTAAVKLARAYTGRDRIAVCGGQPFFSTDDWFIGTTPMNAGVPAAVASLTSKFCYNDSSSLESLFQSHPGEIAAVVLEAETIHEPLPGFLDSVVSISHANGALVILDEIITGFRWHNGGARAYYGLEPDLAVYGKALGNGFAVSALVGRRELMLRGGLNHPHPRVFLLSTTHGAEHPSLAAARAVMRTYRDQPVVATLRTQGSRLSAAVMGVVSELGLSKYFEVLGRPCNLVYVTRDAAGEPSQLFRTLFLRETLKRGLIMPSMVVSCAHTDSVVDSAVDRIGEALLVYKLALEQGIDKYLTSRPVKPVMRRYN